MARRRKNNRQGFKTPLKFFIISVFAVFFLYVIVSRSAFFFNHARMFRVAEVVRSPALQHVHSRHLDNLEGRNIFAIDLKGIQRRVQSEYPSIERLRIIRQLPNRVLITAEKREPFALVRNGSLEAVIAEDGVVIESHPGSASRLPCLSGILDARSFEPGAKVPGSRVPAGIAILQEIRNNAYLKNVAVSGMDLDNLSKIHVYFDGTEVIMDRSKIQKKIETLGLLFSDAGIPRDKINYVDLRFKEPAINQR